MVKLTDHSQKRSMIMIGMVLSWTLHLILSQLISYNLQSEHSVYAQNTTSKSAQKPKKASKSSAKSSAKDSAKDSAKSSAKDSAKDSAKNVPKNVPKKNSKRLSMSAKTWTVLSIRNDQDFDSSRRFYDPDGQSQGQAVTALRPAFRWHTDQRVQLYYQAEIGWESWGAVNSSMPHPYGPNRLSGLSMRHREMWGQYAGEMFELRTGFQKISDPSRLFLSHLMGAVRVRVKLKKLRLTFSFGQLPENQFEGMLLNEDNWIHDNLIGNFKIKWKSNALRVHLGGSLMRDHRVVDRPLILGVGSVEIKWSKDHIKTRVSFAYQGGEWRNSGVAGVDQKINAWASNGGIVWKKNKISVSSHYLLLSADDKEDGDAEWGGFFYTGQNNSATLILTQDESRDRYDNLDERLATAWGSHFIHRAGLGIWDLSFGYQVSRYLNTQLVYGLGFVLVPENVLGHQLVGSEVGILNTFKLSPISSLWFHAQLFAPGKASSVMINDRNRDATRFLYGLQGGFSAAF